MHQHNKKTISPSHYQHLHQEITHALFFHSSSRLFYCICTRRCTVRGNSETETDDHFRKTIMRLRSKKTGRASVRIGCVCQFYPIRCVQTKKSYVFVSRSLACARVSFCVPMLSTQTPHPQIYQHQRPRPTASSSGMGLSQSTQRLDDAFSDEEGSGLCESPVRQSYRLHQISSERPNRFMP